MPSFRSWALLLPWMHDKSWPSTFKLEHLLKYINSPNIFFNFPFPVVFQLLIRALQVRAPMAACASGHRPTATNSCASAPVVTLEKLAKPVSQKLPAYALYWLKSRFSKNFKVLRNCIVLGKSNNSFQSQVAWFLWNSGIGTVSLKFKKGIGIQWNSIKWNKQFFLQLRCLNLTFVQYFL